MSSQPLKRGFSFFNESAHAFALIMRTEKLAKGLRLGVELEIETGALGKLIEQPFRAGDRRVGLKADGPGELQDRSMNLSAGINMIDEADCFSFFGFNPAAGENQLLGPRQAHELRQPDGCAKARNDAQAHFGLAKDGLLTCHNEIAGDRELRPAAQGETVDGRDCRLGHQLKKLSHLVTELGEKNAFA